MSDDSGFAPPPFKPDEALLRLKRELRELGLAEREGVFERRGLAVARVRVDGVQLVGGDRAAAQPRTARSGRRARWPAAPRCATSAPR